MGIPNTEKREKTRVQVEGQVGSLSLPPDSRLCDYLTVRPMFPINTSGKTKPKKPSDLVLKMGIFLDKTIIVRTPVFFPVGQLKCGQVVL